MDFVYLFIDENNWEDMIIFLTEEDAIKESKKYPKARVETSCTSQIYQPPTNHFTAMSGSPDTNWLRRGTHGND